MLIASSLICLWSDCSEQLGGVRASRFRNALAFWNERNALDFTVRHPTPFNRLSTERSRNDFAALVIVALVKGNAFTHGAVSLAVTAFFG
jgi:hypothetical protein